MVSDREFAGGAAHRRRMRVLAFIAIGLGTFLAGFAIANLIGADESSPTVGPTPTQQPPVP